MKADGYRHESDPRPTCFTEEEKSLAVVAQLLNVATEDAELRLTKLKTELFALQVRCTHAVFRDKVGTPHDLRYCCICSAFKGQI